MLNVGESGSIVHRVFAGVHPILKKVTISLSSYHFTCFSLCVLCFLPPPFPHKNNHEDDVALFADWAGEYEDFLNQPMRGYQRK